jgi:hypothetical protein
LNKIIISKKRQTVANVSNCYPRFFAFQVTVCCFAQPVTVVRIKACVNALPVFTFATHINAVSYLAFVNLFYLQVFPASKDSLEVNNFCSCPSLSLATGLKLLQTKARIAKTNKQ